jgi:hypothetical protein
MWPGGLVEAGRRKVELLGVELLGVELLGMVGHESAPGADVG